MPKWQRQGMPRQEFSRVEVSRTLHQMLRVSSAEAVDNGARLPAVE